MTNSSVECSEPILNAFRRESAAETYNAAVALKRKHRRMAYGAAALVAIAATAVACKRLDLRPLEAATPAWVCVALVLIRVPCCCARARGWARCVVRFRAPQSPRVA